MKNAIQIGTLIFLLITGVDIETGNADASPDSDLLIRIIRSCERQDDSVCVTKKCEQALLDSSSLSNEDNLIIRYELAARYEYYEGDPQKARNMYLEIERMNPHYGITQLCMKRLNRQMSILVDR